MYRRLTILTTTILIGLGSLTLLGHHALGKWAEGLQGTRLGEYAKIAEHVQGEVSERIDAFLDLEQTRPYTDYLYYHVPELGSNTPSNQILLRSPLGGQMEHGLAYGHFQIEQDGTVTTPNDDIVLREGDDPRNRDIAQQVAFQCNLVGACIGPMLSTTYPGADKPPPEVSLSFITQPNSPWEDVLPPPQPVKKFGSQKKIVSQQQAGQALEINNFRRGGQSPQLMQQKRSVYRLNLLNSGFVQPPTKGVQALGQTDLNDRGQIPVDAFGPHATHEDNSENDAKPLPSTKRDQASEPAESDDNVQVRVEPLQPHAISDANSAGSLFSASVFMLRRVQVEDKHFVQGFQLNEAALVREIEAAAQQAVAGRPEITFQLARERLAGGAHAAVLLFEFGEVVLTLFETNPDWLSQEVHWLRTWYLSIVLVVLTAVGLGLMTLWRGTTQQFELARKKDDFISAVSHELRTPLTSMRMYAEMLENGWTDSPSKQQQYYRNIRQEGERLSRLIENVLDFSRIQRGNKRYAFASGDLNACVQATVDMMQTYAQRLGFTIRTDLCPQEATVFDRDALTQIVVNLLDNSLKYAKEAEDKTILVRTRQQDAHTLIEVEDHGPGVPPKQSHQIFDEFYRLASESTRQTQGTGLGLALVKQFALAHEGHVRISPAQPCGCLFQVAISQNLAVS